MILTVVCILAILMAIIANAFARNLNGVLGFGLALTNYIALQIVLETIKF